MKDKLYMTDYKTRSKTRAYIYQDYKFFVKIINDCNIEKMKVREKYEIKNALDKALSNLKGMYTKLHNIEEYLNIKESDVLIKIRESIELGEKKLDDLYFMETVDEESKLKEMKWTGLEGSIQNDQILLRFLREFVYRNTKVGRLDSMKNFLAYAKTLPDKISVHKNEGSLDKDMIIEFLQQLIIFEHVVSIEPKTVKEKIDKSRRLDKVVYKIHKNFQMSLPHLVNTLKDISLFDTMTTNFFMRSTRHFLRYENLPKWVVKSWMDYEENKYIPEGA